MPQCALMRPANSHKMEYLMSSRSCQFSPKLSIRLPSTFTQIIHKIEIQQPLAYIFQTLFQHELFVISTPTLNADSRYVSHGNTITMFVMLL
jgi:hypothetical protein